MLVRQPTSDRERGESLGAGSETCQTPGTSWSVCRRPSTALSCSLGSRNVDRLMALLIEFRVFGDKYFFDVIVKANEISALSIRVHEY